MRQKIESFSGTTITYFLHDGNQLIAELDENGVELRSYLWGAAIDELLSQTEAGVTYYALHDQQFTVTGLTDSAGGVVETYTYDAFGNSTDNIQNRITPFGYTGRYIESDINLYDYRNRFYDPELGRFMTPDPALFIDGPNLYTYVGNECPNRRDPFGLKTDDDCEPKLGSEGTPIPPNTKPGVWLEKNVPVVNEFANLHDGLYKGLPKIPGVPTEFQPGNIPTMPPTLGVGLAIGIYNLLTGDSIARSC